MIVEKIDKFYGNKKDRQDSFIHISGASKCQRQLYYDLTIKKESDIEPRVRRIFDNGNSVHQRLMRVLYQLEDIRVIASEVAIPENPNIRGTCDAMIAIENSNYVIDFKSINSSSFGYLDVPKIDHKIQLLLYMYFFGVERGIILYENKDNQELKEFEISKKENEELILEVFEKLNYVRDCVKDKILPNKPVFLEDDQWRCNYCSYKSECEKNFNVEKDEIAE